MKHICTILLICGLYMGQAWAAGGPVILDGPCDTGSAMHNGNGLFYICEDNVWVESIIWAGIQHGKARNSADLSEIRELLGRCWEITKKGTIIIYPNDQGVPYLVVSESTVDDLRRDIEMLLNRLPNE